jgi:hypothetical protein
MVTVLQYFRQRDNIPPFQGNQRLSAGKGYSLYIGILPTSCVYLKSRNNIHIFPDVSIILQFHPRIAVLRDVEES